MPYQSESQRRLMEGIRNGWHPTGLKNPPSKAVAEKFHVEDKIARRRGLLADHLKKTMP